MDERDIGFGEVDQDSTIWLQVLHQYVSSSSALISTRLISYTFDRLLDNPANLSTLYWRTDSSFAFHRFHETRFEELHQLGITSTDVLVVSPLSIANLREPNQ